MGFKDLSKDKQLEYLRKHKKSKLHPFINDQDENTIEIKHTMGKFNSMVEGKEYKVMKTVNDWETKLTNSGFQLIETSENKKIFVKNNLVAEIIVSKGPMRYIGSFNIKYLQEKAASTMNYENLISEVVNSFDLNLS